MTARPSLATDHLTLEDAAGRLHCTPKTLAAWLKKNPQEPPLFAKPGRDYIISPAYFLRIYKVLQIAYGTARFYLPEYEAALTKPSREDGFVYFIQGQTTGLIKIGFAVNPQKRIKILATGCTEHLKILCVQPGTRDHERRAHEKFAHLRQKGEWFLPGKPLLAFIKKASAR
jgi:hypothetical protein